MHLQAMIRGTLMSRDTIKLKGHVRLVLRDKYGKALKTIEQKNLVVDIGLEEFAKVIAGTKTHTTGTYYIALGDNATEPTGAQTALLGTEHTRKQATSSQSGPQVTIIATGIGTGLGTSVTVEEAGIFDAVSPGNMCARFLTGNFTLDNSVGETVDITWTLTLV